MYIVRTPFRISFFGGGTDYETYFNEYGGSVISTTIDKYCYVTVRHLPAFYDYENQLTYSKIERFNDISELEHPLVREALRFVPVNRVQISYDADLPAGSGMGSSSSFAVGLLKGLHAMRSEFPDKTQLAKEAIFVERKMCKEAGGIQDQIAVSFGGFNRITFSKDGFSVKPINITDKSKSKLSENLMLLFTGFTRCAARVSIKQQANISSSIGYLNEMDKLTDEAELLLKSDRIDDFGRLLNYTWNLKKKLSDDISNESIDNIYDRAIQSGAFGGKLLGAGSGGFMLLYAPKENQSGIKKALNEFQFFSLNFDEVGTEFLIKR